VTGDGPDDAIARHSEKVEGKLAHKNRQQVPAKPGDRKYRGGKSYPIPIWNGIFEHAGRIGEALWEFLWCIDKVTKERDGVGLVLGGAPVKLERIATDLSCGKETARRHFKKLEKEGYIRTRRTPYGQVIEVLNSRKFGIWKPKKKPETQPTEKPQNDVSLDTDSATEKHQNEVSPVLQKPIYEPEKHQSDVSKEDAATRHSSSVAVVGGVDSDLPVVEVEKRGAQKRTQQNHKPTSAAAADSPETIEAFKFFAANPFGSKAFQQAWTTAYKNRTSDLSDSDVMERCAEDCKLANVKVPSQFFVIKRHVETAEVKRKFSRGVF
jgi:hypothetical protein